MENFWLPVLFSLSPVNMLFHCLLTSIVSDEKSTVCSNVISLYVMCYFPLATFKICFGFQKVYYDIFVKLVFCHIQFFFSINLESFPSLFLLFFFCLILSVSSPSTQIERNFAPGWMICSLNHTWFWWGDLNFGADDILKKF